MVAKFVLTYCFFKGMNKLEGALLKWKNAMDNPAIKSVKSPPLL